MLKLLVVAPLFLSVTAEPISEFSRFVCKTSISQSEVGLSSHFTLQKYSHSADRRNDTTKAIGDKIASLEVCYKFEFCETVLRFPADADAKIGWLGPLSMIVISDDMFGASGGAELYFKPRRKGLATTLHLLSERVVEREIDYIEFDQDSCSPVIPIIRTEPTR